MSGQYEVPAALSGKWATGILNRKLGGSENFYGYFREYVYNFSCQDSNPRLQACGRYTTLTVRT
jgi:hypothetical protein